MRTLLRAVCCIIFGAGIAGCAATPPQTVTELSFWGMGWQFKGVHNRVQPAIPPVLRFVRDFHPDVQPALRAEQTAADIRRAMMGLRGADRTYLQRRMVGVFLVTGLRCGAGAVRVSDGDATVAAFVVLDVDALSGDPADWVSCDGRSSAPQSTSALGRLLVQVVKDPSIYGWIIYKR